MKSFFKSLTERKKGSSAKEDKVPSEVVAAIGLALCRYESDLHDMESTVLTINRAAKAYSPWNSKIYGMQNQPIKNSRR